MRKDYKYLKSIYFIFFLKIFIASCFAQQQESQRDSYTFGAGEKLQISVHIWGEIMRPGQYIVPDGTNVLELISLAGGPSEYSSLRNIRVTRTYFPSEQEHLRKKNIVMLRRKEIYKINLNSYLGDKNYLQDLYVLQPGDVVRVNRNLWFRFQTLLKTIYQVAVIAQGLYWWSQLVQ